MKKQIAVLIVVVLGLVIVATTAIAAISQPDKVGISSTTTADNITLEFTSNKSRLILGQVIEFTAIITNSDIVSRNLFYSSPLLGSTALISHTAGMIPGMMGSLEWNGVVSAGSTVVLTYTAQVNMIVKVDLNVGATVNNSAGVPIVSIALTLSKPNTVYLPIAVKNYEITPTPTAPSVMLFAVHTASMESFGIDYAVTLAGTYPYNPPNGRDPFPNSGNLFITQTLYGLAQCKSVFNEYRIYRAYFEFDTSIITTTISSARLEFDNHMAYPGPPVHNINIYNGTWASPLVDDNYQVSADKWNAYNTVITQITGNYVPEIKNEIVNIPINYINLNGMTKFAFKSSTEGTPPSDNSCGWNTALGGLVGYPLLYITP